MKENLSTIATRCGVSITTVSRVLNGNADKYRISEDTVEKVLSEARRYNYSPNRIAQNLRTQKTHSIGLLIPSLSNVYFAQMASVIISEIHKRGYMTIVMDTMEDQTTFEESLQQLISRNVDGIIASPCGKDATMVEHICEQGLPFVLIDRYYEGSPVPYVVTNNYAGGMTATNALISAGHRNIACIQGVESSTANIERVQGYVSAMQSAGLEEFVQISGNEFSVQNGYLETKLLLLQERRPTAIFSLSNTITLGIIKAINEANLSIPGDISILSFDSFQYMDYISPALTRIGQPVEDMAMLASKLLFTSIEQNATGTSQIKLAPAIVPGGSVAFIQSNNQ